MDKHDCLDNSARLALKVAGIEPNSAGSCPGQPQVVALNVLHTEGLCMTLKQILTTPIIGDPWERDSMCIFQSVNYQLRRAVLGWHAVESKRIEKCLKL